MTKENSVPTSRYTPREIIERGQQRYERDIRAKVEVHQGKMLALDIDSGEYALGDDSIMALDRLKAKVPEAPAYLLRVGFRSAVRFGMGNKVTQLW
jgi:hypothetical protein